MATSLTQENKRIVADVITSGAIAGVLGGIALGLILCLQSAATGMGFFFPIQLASGVFYGDDAILGGVGPTVAGLVIYVVSSVILGCVFALFLRPRTPTTDAVAFGLIFGIVVWALRSYIVLPSFNPTLTDRMNLIPGWWFLGHLAFGAILGSIPTIRQTLARRETTVRPSKMAA